MLASRWVLGGYVFFAGVACGGSFKSDTPVDGGAAGSVTAAGTGGSSGAAGSGVGGEMGGQGGTIDCSLAGCAPPPLCRTGCTDVCGCCACGEGMVQGNLVCHGGCWVESDAGAPGCTYRGRVYPYGATFWQGDGC